MNHDLSIFLSTKSLIVFILVLTRMAGMLSIAPFFSTFPIPARVKAGLAAMIAFIIYPIVLSKTSFEVPTELISLSLFIAKEFFVGFIIGFCALIIFMGIQMGGQLLSIQMGLAVSNVLDPVTKQQVPVVGQFYMYIASMAFIYISGHQWLFGSVLGSYDTIPIGLNFLIDGVMVDKIIQITSQLFRIAFSAVIPIYGILLICDVSLGFIAKM
ncbi:MAG: flagellar biosynthetic protein FliR, partial [Candidatus Gastranaerophilales bacterium]|nr:flagellar biosynthetic protein FliR [Candidatus Gastranaerophilales bacterium]